RHSGRTPRPVVRASDGLAPVRPGQDDGQDASIVSTTSCVSEPVNQFTIPVQKVPAPTSPGMRSDASNRITASGSARISAESWSNDVARFSGSRPLLALTQPPWGVVSAFVLAQSALER